MGEDPAIGEAFDRNKGGQPFPKTGELEVRRPAVEVWKELREEIEKTIVIGKGGHRDSLETLREIALVILGYIS
ncbi:MAG: hypothetical protein ACE5I5_18440 [Candidatus Heimdallarchaeota archaeon]